MSIRILNYGFYRIWDEKPRQYSTRTFEPTNCDTYEQRLPGDAFVVNKVPMLDSWGKLEMFEMTSVEPKLHMNLMFERTRNFNELDYTRLTNRLELEKAYVKHRRGKPRFEREVFYQKTLDTIGQVIAARLEDNAYVFFETPRHAIARDYQFALRSAGDLKTIYVKTTGELELGEIKTKVHSHMFYTVSNSLDKEKFLELFRYLSRIYK